MGEKDYYYVQANFPDENGLKQFEEDLEILREDIKSSNPGFSIMVRRRYSMYRPCWAATQHYFNGYISLRGGERTEKVIKDFNQGAEKIFEKHKVRRF